MPLGICVIGAGDLGTNHAKNWLTVPDVQLISVADPNLERANASGEKYGFQSVHGDYREALDQPGIDAVSVAVPEYLHRECSEAAMERGYHVMCEKPISLTVEDAEAMIATRDRTGVKLAFGFCKRFLGQVHTLRDLVQEGRIGRPCVYRFVTGCERRPKMWIMDRRYGGGPVIDFCCHYFDQWGIIFGGKPARVMAAGMTFSQGAEELPNIEPELDTANFTVEYDTGDIGVISITWGLPRGVQTGSFEDLIGPRGVIDIQGLKTLTLKTRGGEEIFDDLDADMYAKQLQAFARSIREDLPVPASAEDALAALKVSLAVIESARTHEVVKL